MAKISKVTPADNPYFVGMTVFLFRTGLLLRDEAPLVAQLLEECGFKLTAD